MAPYSDRSTSVTVGHGLFPALMSFPIACFIGTLVTDIAYVRTTLMTWETFSIWLLTAGLIVAGVVVVIGLVEAFGRGLWPTRSQRLGYAVALVLALVNAFVHSRDGYTSVMPEGLILSVATVVIVLVTLLLNRTNVARRTAIGR